jgi:cupin superfamily acireductone dioxygenase involved in methionine salvage
MTKAQKARFKRAVEELNDLLKEVRQTHPEANYYMEGEGNFYMLSGESHDRNGCQRQDRVLAHENVPHASGGAW